MKSPTQNTLTNSCRYSGITLHTGVRAHISFNPAAANSGVNLVRVDLPHRPRIRALATNVTDVQRATTIANGEAQIHTVEHVLAALYACGIDNVEIEMDGPEPPIADGSSAPYIELIMAAGITALKATPVYFRVTEPFYISQGESKLIALPSPEYRLTCTVKYGASLMDTQYLSLAIDQHSFIQDLSKARTFCLYPEIEPLMRKGLIRGGSLDNAVVVKDGAIICKEGLRYPDEFVRHKMLDIIGDLSLSGCRIQGEIIAIKPGHPSNVAMAQKIIAIREKQDARQY
jgi:UDP-3-O-acyl N-acetylglucosamine deacetylase